MQQAQRDGSGGNVAGRVLSFEERVEIEVGLRVGESQATIARRLGRSRSVICRELQRNKAPRWAYRASAAQLKALRRRPRPKPARLAQPGLLRTVVLAGLRQHHSPQQISGRLERLFPDDAAMHASHETIYQAIYLQARGGLRTELERALRTGRTSRRPQRQVAAGVRSRRSWAQPRIAERPAEVSDRAVPGHWEGDLLMGAANKSAIVVLVERTSRFTLLAALPDGWTTDATTTAITGKITELPEQLRRTLTWDCGNEMAGHARFTVATGVQCYFCDPHHPWQKATVENTNGLLREYFPKHRFDFRTCSQDYLDAVAQELNDRPRAVLDFATPRETLNALLVATTS
jgi:IS30 family transposase